MLDETLASKLFFLPSLCQCLSFIIIIIIIKDVVSITLKTITGYTFLRLVTFSMLSCLN